MLEEEREKENEKRTAENSTHSMYILYTTEPRQHRGGSASINQSHLCNR